MKAMILAAGYGTRFRPITYTLPKPMVPVCNRPMIAYAVDQFLRAGIDEIVVNLHHLPEAIESYLRETYDGQATFAFSFEPEILGTGGGIRKVRALLENEEEFFVVNGDTIQFPRYEDLRAARRADDALAALTLRHPPAGDTFTAVWVDGSNVTGFGEGTGRPLMFAGSHAISPRIFRYLPEEAFSGIVEHAYQPVLAEGRETIAAVVDDGLWFDIGNPQRYMAATRALREAMLHGEIAFVADSRAEGTSIVHRTARVTGLAGRSVVGARSVIEGELRASVVWDDCRIAQGVQLTSCIVAHGVELNHPMELENALICRDDEAIARDGAWEIEGDLVIAPI
jgi:mannose-1-phosphate guanylyltransferase